MTSKLAPPSRTGLAALPVLVIDLETTGLDVRRDRVLQVAAIAMMGSHFLDAPRLDRTVDPGVPIPPSATRIHGLADSDVAGAPRFAAMARQLHDAIAGRIVVGHHIAFDLAILRHEAARAGVAWHVPPALDIALLLGALDPARKDLSLEAAAALLGVTIRGRHSALGDAMAAAEIFGRLIARLRDADVRTLGEARSFAARRTDLVRREMQSGWHSAPGAEAPLPGRIAPARIDSYVFERRLQEVMSTPPVAIGAEATVRQAARLMAEQRIGSLLVGAAGARPQGMLTERELLGMTAAGRLDPDCATVAQVMRTPAPEMAGTEMLYRALGHMDRSGASHLCVVDGAGAAIGMVSQRDLLRHRARSALSLEDALATSRTSADLAAAFGQVSHVAEALVAEGLGGIEVARVVSNEVRAVTARAATITVDALSAAGRPPPAMWCVLVLGSGGRGESLLGADQDNALIHGGSAADDAWFADLGTGIADLLDQAGVPRCKGGVMAANADWRGTPAHWDERVAGWLRHARPQDMLNVDIFFDLMPVAGEVDLGRRLLESAVAAAARSLPFLALLAESVAQMQLPLGFFGRLRTRDGRVDLKAGGLLPVVSFARTIALRAGSTARATTERLQDAVAAGRLAGADAEMLMEIHAELLSAVLRQQLVDLDDGVRPSGRVAPRLLRRAEIRHLERGLKRLDEILQDLRGALAG